jgi:21S rRNA (GM2251-2'-O)-methyltransferase
MMGAEATGLRSGLLNVAHYNIGIRHSRDVDDVGVDSLNVSVAASLLCYKMLQKPKAKTAAPEVAEDALF